jgi:hypothetical protein
MVVPSPGAWHDGDPVRTAERIDTKERGRLGRGVALVGARVPARGD